MRKAYVPKRNTDTVGTTAIKQQKSSICLKLIQICLIDSNASVQFYSNTDQSNELFHDYMAVNSLMHSQRKRRQITLRDVKI